MSFSQKIRVGVLRGGPSPEYDVSLKTGSTILANLPEEYVPLDIFISKEGVWHTSGLEKDPHKILKMVDVVINAMHGAYGEDGSVQRILEHFNILYTGSGPMSSAFGMNKIMSKNIFNRSGLKTPHHIVIVASSATRQGDGKNIVTDEMISQINQNIPFPIIVKPANSGSSLGISFVDKTSQIENALKKAFEHSPKLIVEEYINGKEATCGVIEGFRNTSTYSLPPVEIIRPQNKHFYDYDSKYNVLKSEYKVPGNFTEDEKKQIQEAAILIHKILGLRHYSRSDFILHPKRGLFVLEVNTLPELSHHSSFIKSLEAVGGNIKEFLSHLLSKTLGKK